MNSVTIFTISLFSFMAGGFTFFIVGYVRFCIAKKREATELSGIFKKIAEDIAVHERNSRRPEARA